MHVSYTPLARTKQHSPVATSVITSKGRAASLVGESASLVDRIIWADPSDTERVLQVPRLSALRRSAVVEERERERAREGRKEGR